MKFDVDEERHSSEWRSSSHCHQNQPQNPVLSTETGDFNMRYTVKNKEKIMWIDLLNNPMIIQSIYDSPPDLDAVFVHDVRVDLVRKSLSISFDLNIYPEKPPQKWVKQDFNTVQVTLGVLDVESVAIGDVKSTSCSMQIEKIDGSISLRVLNGIDCLCTGKHLYMAKISAYKNA